MFDRPYMVGTSPSLMAHRWQPLSGTVLWYPGQDDAYSALIRDRSGYVNNGTIVGATWGNSTNGVWDLRYDGNDYINIDVVVNNLSATTVGTWMTWLKLDDATPVATSNVIAFGDTNANEIIAMRILTDGKLDCHMRIAAGAKWEVKTDNATLSNGAYCHIALIQDATLPVIVVNGVSVAQSTITANDTTTWIAGAVGIDNARIGCENRNSGGNTNFVTNGNTFGTALVNTNLTVGQVKGIYDIQRTWLGV